MSPGSSPASSAGVTLAPSCIFAVFGAMTKNTGLEVGSFDDLTGAGIVRDAGFAAVFIAAAMNPPGIDPLLELR